MAKNKPRIRMIVAEDEDGFTAFAKISGIFVVAKGATFDDFLENLLEAVNAAFQEEGFQYSLSEISLVSSKAAGISLMDAYKEFNESSAKDA